MKLWHIAALLVGVGIVYVLVRRPSVNGIMTPHTSNATNNTLSSLFSFGTAIVNKIGAPSAVDPSESAAVYRPGESFDDYTAGLFGPGTAV